MARKSSRPITSLSAGIRVPDLVAISLSIDYWNNSRQDSCNAVHSSEYWISLPETGQNESLPCSLLDGWAQFTMPGIISAVGAGAVRVGFGNSR